MGTIILFVIVLSILVVVHEWGHFITAKKSGMRVYEFGIGFPPRAIGCYKDPKTKKLVWVKGGDKGALKETVGGEDRVAKEYPATVYSLNWLPLGGFVKIKGENGEAAGETDSFVSKKWWQKLVVLVAGVVMNIALAAVLLGIGFMVGLPADLSGDLDPRAIVVQEAGVTVQQVVSGSPAEEAGLTFGDRIVRFGGEEVGGSSDFVTLVERAAGVDTELILERKGEEVAVSLTPIMDEGQEKARIGVALVDAGVIRYPWYLAIWKGITGAFIGLINIFVGFYFLIKGLIGGQGLIFEVSGPVGIAVAIGDSARLGFNYLLNMAAVISLSLAAINILPIPALDGGRALFVIIEKITGRPVPLKYEQVAHTIGFLLLMVLIIVITGRDIISLF